MPIVISFVEPEGFIQLVGTGEITDEQYLASIQEIGALAPRLPQDVRMLADWSAATTFGVSGLLMRTSGERLRELIEHRPGRHRKATVAHTPAVYGLARMWEMSMAGTGIECGIFETYAEARGWLLDNASPVMGEVTNRKAGA